MYRKLGIIFLSLLLTACLKKPEALPILPDASLLDMTELEQIRAIRDDVLQLLESKDYDGLENKIEKGVGADSPFGNGISTTTYVYAALCDLPEDATEDDYKKRLAELSAWRQQHPDSVPAVLALAGLTTDYAWFARGGGEAGTVTQEGWATFGKRLDESRELLESIQSKASGNYQWYRFMAQVGLGLSLDHDAFLDLIKRGVELQPKSPELYYRASIYLLPRWMGSYQELETFASRSSDAVGGDEGDILYARIAKGIWSYSYDTDVFRDAGFSWPRVRHGMELICKRYPHSTNMMNYFCLFATQVEDRELARFLFQHLGNRYDDDYRDLTGKHDENGAWWKYEDFEKSKNWAEGN